MRDAGGVVEGTLCYTGDVTNTKTVNKYDLDYYLKLAGGFRVHLGMLRVLAAPACSWFASLAFRAPA